MKIRYFVSYYNDAVPERDFELTQVREVHERQQADGLVEVIDVQPRPTFKDMFEKVREIASEDDISIIMNSDCYLTDEALTKLRDFDFHGGKKILALSRYDLQPEGIPPIPHHNPDSQDAWICKGHVRPLRFSNFHLGVPGCLHGDTIVKINRGKREGTRDITLRDLHEIHQSGKSNGRFFRDFHIPTFIHSITDEGKIFKNRLVKSIYSGVKSCIELKFDDGSNLICTPDHPILAHLDGAQEFVPAETLKIGTDVYSLGRGKLKFSGGKKKTPYRKPIYLKYHPHAENKTVRGHKYKRVVEQRLSYEAALNGKTLQEFVSILQTNEVESKKMIFSDPKMEIHHIDHDHTNNAPENLILLSKADHAKYHMEKREHELVAFKKLISITYAGMHDVYDLQMEAPAHNFLANRTFVHNCDNRIAHEFKLVGYIPENRAIEFPLMHLHLSGIRNQRPKDRVPPPYLLLPVIHD